MASEHLEHKLALLPDKPGCYLMKNINDQIIYETDKIQITPAGIGYLLDNNFIKKAREFLKDVKSIVPFV